MISSEKAGNKSAETEATEMRKAWFAQLNKACDEADAMMKPK